MQLRSFLLWQWLVVGTDILAATAIPTQNQVYLGSSDQSHEIEQPSVGVGFDLAASYATAAISLPDGTIRTVAKIDAEDGYDKMLKRLSLDSSRHLSPPYQHVGDSWSDAPRQALRKARKAMGLPASADVGYLARMIIALRSAVEDHLQTSISSAGITTMHLTALYPEDVRDACEYAGLEYLSFPVWYEMLYETSTAYAGYGHGLCEKYMEKEGCRKEQEDMESEVVMAVLFTPSVLTVSLSVVKSAYYVFEPAYRHHSDFELGYNSTRRQQGEQGYWSAVTSELEAIMGSNLYYPRPAKVLLMGDGVVAEEFQSALQLALKNQTEVLPDILSRDAVFTAAKGAAEMTRRLPWDPYKNSHHRPASDLKI